MFSLINSTGLFRGNVKLYPVHLLGGLNDISKRWQGKVKKFNVNILQLSEIENNRSSGYSGFVKSFLCSPFADFWMVSPTVLGFELNHK